MAGNGRAAGIAAHAAGARISTRRTAGSGARAASGRGVHAGDAYPDAPADRPDEPARGRPAAP